MSLASLPLSVPGTTVGSTVQMGEPMGESNAPFSGRSVWYSFTPSSEVHVFIGTCENPAHHSGGLYRGSTLATLVVETFPNGGSDAIECPGAANNAQANGYDLHSGVTYRYQLNGFDAAGAAFNLRFFLLPPSAPPASAPTTPTKQKCKKGQKLKKGKCVKKKRKK